METEAITALFEVLGFRHGLTVLALAMIYREIRRRSIEASRVRAADKDLLSQELVHCRERLNHLEDRLTRRGRGRITRFFTKK